MFGNRSCYPVGADTPTGNGYETKFEFEFNENGEKVLVAKGVINVYERIQSHKDSVSLDKMIERFTLTGDYSHLVNKEGNYLNILNAPKSLMDAQNTILKASSLFDNLPANIKQIYSNNFSVFLNSLQSSQGHTLLTHLLNGGFVDEKTILGSKEVNPNNSDSSQSVSDDKGGKE